MTVRDRRILDARGDNERFRGALRAWLAAAVPAGWQRRLAGASEAVNETFQREWLRALSEVGLSTPHWPSQWGGEDMSLDEQVIVYEEMARMGAPLPLMYVISLYHLPATLFAAGTAEQQALYLPGVRERGDVWCQGFSEPAAGSDLASLRTAAVRDGEGYRVNGHKTWSSFAQHARYCLLLARTDPAAPKHAGISYFIMDMASPGVTVKPIAQISGGAEFSEIFIDDVFIPGANLIGSENAGWNIAQSTLSAERSLAAFEHTERMAQAFARLLEDIRAGRAAWYDDDQLRREFLAAYVDMRAVQGMMLALLQQVKTDPHLGGEALASIIKVHYSELLQQLNAFVVRIQGLEAQVAQNTLMCAGLHTSNAMHDFLTSYLWTISAGTNEIQRNIIAERVLGLPR